MDDGRGASSAVASSMSGIRKADACTRADRYLRIFLAAPLSALGDLLISESHFEPMRGGGVEVVKKFEQVVAGNVGNAR